MTEFTVRIEVVDSETKEPIERYCNTWHVQADDVETAKETARTAALEDVKLEAIAVWAATPAVPPNRTT